jgi:hypothetical protein
LGSCSIARTLVSWLSTISGTWATGSPGGLLKLLYLLLATILFTLCEVLLSQYTERCYDHGSFSFVWMFFAVNFSCGGCPSLCLLRIGSAWIILPLQNIQWRHCQAFSFQERLEINLLTIILFLIKLVSFAQFATKLKWNKLWLSSHFIFCWFVAVMEWTTPTFLISIKQQICSDLRTTLWYLFVAE